MILTSQVYVHIKCARFADSGGVSRTWVYPCLLLLSACSRDCDGVPLCSAF